MSYAIAFLIEIVANKVAAHVIDKVVVTASDYIEDPIKKEYRTTSEHICNLRYRYDNEDDVVIISKRHC